MPKTKRKSSAALRKAKDVANRYRNRRRSSAEAVFPEIEEYELPLAPEDAGMQPGTRYYRMADLTCFVSPPHEETGTGWHMSCAGADRAPEWDEIAHLRYELVPAEVTMALLLPPEDKYVNLHEWTMQLIQVDYGQLGNI